MNPTARRFHAGLAGERAGAQIEFWWGLVGPARMMPEVVKRLNDELNAVLAQPDMREALAHQAATPRPGPARGKTSASCWRSRWRAGAS